MSVPGSLTRPTTDRQGGAVLPAGRLRGHRRRPGSWTSTPVRARSGWKVPAAARVPWTLVEFDGKASEVCQRNADLVNTVTREKTVSVHRSKVESFLDRAAVSDPLGPGVPGPPVPAGRGGPGRGAREAAPAPGRGRAVVVVDARPGPRSRAGRRGWNVSRRRSTAKPGFGSPSPAWRQGRRRRPGLRRRGTTAEPPAVVPVTASRSRYFRIVPATSGAEGTIPYLAISSPSLPRTVSSSLPSKDSGAGPWPRPRASS